MEMKNENIQIELLAPAQNAEIGMAAVNFGADAVYIGAERFGAREKAGNSIQAIEELTAYAHLYYAKVYVTFNTILNDQELDEAFELINNLAHINIDGIIIQDVGLLELPLPSIPLIASTQMHNNSLEKIQFLEKIGFSRVILPREMNLAEIKQIREHSSIDLECFIHGALCVCYSGQCYLSYSIGGRSANRGACAQPCRQAYSLVDSHGRAISEKKHLLSLKDLNRSDSLDELISAGISSFKIEGRLKDINYVKNTVACYRKELDRILSGRTLKRSSSGSTTLGFTPNLDKTFSRGYTNFGLNGNRKEMGSIHTPKALGEKIGAVAKVAHDHFSLNTSHDIHNGDGICFFDKTQILQGCKINTVKEQRIYPDKMPEIAAGTIIYRNHDHVFIKALSAKNASSRKIALDLHLSETKDGFQLEAKDENNNTITVCVQSAKEPAQKKDLAENNIRTQLNKLNDTIFFARSISHSLNEAYFIPLSILNNIRREAIETIMVKREQQRPKEQGRLIVNDLPYPADKLDYRANCLNQKAIEFYQRHKVQQIEPAAESGGPMKGRTLMVSRYCIKGELGLCRKELGPLFLLDDKGNHYPLIFDCPNCHMHLLAKD